MLHTLWVTFVRSLAATAHIIALRTSARTASRTAVALYTYILSLQPALAQVRLDRGVLLYRELGDVSRAIADFDQLLHDNPAYGPALLNRALARQSAGDFAAALADLEQYLVVQPVETDDYRDVALSTRRLLREIVAEQHGDEEGPAP